MQKGQTTRYAPGLAADARRQTGEFVVRAGGPHWMVRLEKIVQSDPEIRSGEPVFAGTRAPVRNLLDSLEGGQTLEEFHEDFPSVTREQAIAFLEEL